MESRIFTRFAGVAALAAGLALAVPAVAGGANQPGTAVDAVWQVEKPHPLAHDRLPVHRTSDFGFFYRDRDGFFFGYDPRDGRRWYRDLRRQYYYDRYYDHRKRRWAHDHRHYRDWHRRYYRQYDDHRDYRDRRYYRDYRDRRDWDDRHHDRRHEHRRDHGHHKKHERGRHKKHERRRGHSDEHRRGRGNDDHRRHGRGRD